PSPGPRRRRAAAAGAARGRACPLRRARASRSRSSGRATRAWQKSLADAVYGACLSRGGTCDNGCAGGYFSLALERRRAMPAMDDDDRPKKKVVHEIGQDLALPSIKELQERIALLNEEIARLQATIASKQGSRNVADQYFKK